MPLYNFQCSNCELVVEKFKHAKDDEVEIVCDECECEEFLPLIGQVQNRTRLNARDNLEKRILPDVDRIQKKVGEGSDSEFLNITGD